MSDEITVDRTYVLDPKHTVDFVREVHSVLAAADGVTGKDPLDLVVDGWQGNDSTGLVIGSAGRKTTLDKVIDWLNQRGSRQHERPFSNILFTTYGIGMLREDGRRELPSLRVHYDDGRDVASFFKQEPTTPKQILQADEIARNLAWKYRTPYVGFTPCINEEPQSPQSNVLAFYVNDYGSVDQLMSGRDLDRAFRQRDLHLESRVELRGIRITEYLGSDHTLSVVGNAVVTRHGVTLVSEDIQAQAVSGITLEDYIAGVSAYVLASSPMEGSRTSFTQDGRKGTGTAYRVLQVFNTLDQLKEAWREKARKLEEARGFQNFLLERAEDCSADPSGNYQKLPRLETPRPPEQFMDAFAIVKYVEHAR